MIRVYPFWDKLHHMFQHIGGVWKPLSVSRVWNVHGTCLPAVSLFFLHRHDVVTPSWFRALESYVLRVLDGKEIKLWSSPSLSVFTVFVDLFFIRTISVGLISGCSIEQYFCCIFIVKRQPSLCAASWRPCNVADPHQGPVTHN